MPTRYATIFIVLILVMGSMPGYAQPEPEEEDLGSTGLFSSYVDGWVSGVEPSPFIGEWADAHKITADLLSSGELKLPAIQIFEKVVAGRMQIGLEIPKPAEFNILRVMINFDTNPDGVLSDGDIRLQFTGAGVHEMLVYSGGVFLPFIERIALGLDEEKADILQYGGIATHHSPNLFQAECDFALEEVVSVLGKELPRGSKYLNKAGYSIIIEAQDTTVLTHLAKIAFGYPEAPVSNDDTSTGYTLEKYADVFYLDHIFFPEIFYIDTGITNIEVFQSVQTESNDLPLVRNKNAYARVAVRNPTSNPLGVQVELKGYHEGPGGLLTYVGSKTKDFTAPVVYDREDYSSTANFLVPKSWTNHGNDQTLRLRAEVNTRGFLDENTLDNIMIENVYFGKTHDMNIYYMQVNEASEASPYLISDIDPNFIDQAKEDFKKLYPSANPRFIELDWEVLGVFSGSQEQLKIELNEIAAGMVLAGIFAIIFGADPDSVHLPDQLFGFRTSGAGSSSPAWAGLSPSYAAWGGPGATRGPGVLTHETTHNIGNNTWGRHVPGCYAAGPDASWPTWGDQSIDQIFADTLGYPLGGVDPLTESYDFMSYCMGGSYSAGDTYPSDPDYPISWVSDYRWIHLYERLRTYLEGSPTPMPRFVANDYVNEMIHNALMLRDTKGLNLDEDGSTRVIFGSISKEGSGKLLPSYTIPGALDNKYPENREASHYLVITYSDNSEEKIPIQANFDDVILDEPHESISEIGFSFWLADNGKIVSISLQDNQGKEFDFLSGSDYVLDASFSMPEKYARGETIRPSFSFNDKTSNRTNLYTQMQYSHDGKNWVDYGPQTMGILPDFSTKLLPGGEKVQFRVRVTDGFTTNYVNALSTVYIDNLPPHVEIRAKDVLPDEMSIVWGSTLSLYADGYDPETGPITDDSAYTWKLVGEDGKLIREVNKQMLSIPLFEKITKVEVHVTDPAGLVDRDTLIIKILPQETVTQTQLDDFKKILEEIISTTTSESDTNTTKPSNTTDAEDDPSLPLPFRGSFLGLLVISMISVYYRRKMKA